MKFSLLKNDRSTYKDEMILALIVAISFTIGIFLTVTAPSFWLIRSTTTKVFGILWIIVGVMFLPGLVYRLFTNDQMNSCHETQHDEEKPK